jgi:hypothetical protein
LQGVNDDRNIRRQGDSFQSAVQFAEGCGAAKEDREYAVFIRAEGV